MAQTLVWLDQSMVSLLFTVRKTVDASPTFFNRGNRKGDRIATFFKWHDIATITWEEMVTKDVCHVHVPCSTARGFPQLDQNTLQETRGDSTQSSRRSLLQTNDLCTTHLAITTF